ncbi:Uncharacterised protein [Mycobacteroides abscessus subsp. abscessus]|nr:Uncharacterised protein [Mycobacteroides abscessus subsp. abscessus]
MPLSVPKSGSQDRNRTAAGTDRRSSTRDSASEFSTDTPIHRFGGQSSLSATRRSRTDRFVRIW